ncbi:MAG TPA: SMP-30/gluconolactonase/LRE family protein [Mycobacteriales bacterium]|jgi:gluconolactonase|nr:SMP-30/gluconolactonase/LRE family protein [Mycobacteriales bacterium]
MPTLPVSEAEPVLGGFRFLEGPAWHPAERHLTFGDIPGDTLYRLGADGVLRTLRTPSNMANGNTYDRQGRLLTCEHATSRVVRQEHDGTLTTLADRYRARELNSPNDVIVARDGTVYFTDPLYGRRSPYGVPREPGQPVQGVYGLGGRYREPTLLVSDVEGPNGLCLSPDERHLYVADTDRRHLRRFGVDGPHLTGGEVFAELAGDDPGEPDGLKVDSAGNVYSCGPGGLHVFDPDGTRRGVLRVPEVTANFTWGDDDLRTLYLCASTTLYRCRTTVPGIPLF